MMYNEGDLVEIIGNTSKHRFSIGEHVTIMQATTDDLIAFNGVYYFFVDEKDIKLIVAHNDRKTTY